MTTLNGFLDSKTAEALKTLYGVDSDSTVDNEAVVAEEDGVNSSWDEDLDANELNNSKDYCDHCDEEITGENLNALSEDEELLCDSCTHREYNHTVDRFLSTQEFDLD